MIKCELCPIQTYCPALKEVMQSSYHDVSHISFESECPLWMIVIEGRNPRTKLFIADREGGDTK